MDIFTRFHLRRPPSSTKKSRPALSTPEIPDLPPRPLTSFESSFPPSPISKSSLDPYATTRSIPDRPVFTPAPTPTPKSRTPSLLRTLKHHPSLSALKSRRKSRGKLRDLLPTPDVDAVPDAASERPLSRLVKKRSLKGSKSIPRGLRFSGDSERWVRPHEEVPPLPSTSTPSEACNFITLAAKLSRPPHHPALCSPGGVEFDCNGASPEQLPSRMRYDTSGCPAIRGIRPYSTDLSPARSTQLSSPRRLSTPASPSRINITTPPRLYLPAQHPHPVPLVNSKTAAPRFDAPDDDVFEGDFEPVFSSSRSSKEAGLDLLRPDEELPAGTPGGSRADLKRGALVDGQKPEKGATRFFSRDMYGPVFNTPSPENTPAHSGPSSQPLSNEATSAAKVRMSKRSSSPFEIKLAPNVTKRMSLDAFGASPGGTTEEHGEDAAEEVLDELEEPSFEVPQSTEDDPLTYFHGTQLSTIQENEPGEGDSWNASRILQTPGTSSRPSDRTPGPPSPFLPPRHRSAPALDEETPRSKSESSSHLLHREIDELRQSLLESENERKQDHREREAAERVVLQLRLDNESKEQAIQQLRDAMRENEEFFDKLQEAHDDLALKCTELRTANAKLEHRLSVDTTSLRSSQTEASSLRARLQIVERTNGHLIRTLAEAKGREADFAAASKEAETQVHARTEDLAAAIANHEHQMATLRRQLAERDEQIAKLQDGGNSAKDEEVENLRGQVQASLVKATEKDGVIADLRDKLQTARFEKDETVVGLQVRIKELEKDQLEITQEKQSLQEDLEAQRADTISHDQFTCLENQLAASADRVDALEAELEDALERLDTANSALSFQDQELATLRETAMDAADTANRISGEAMLKSKEMDRTIQRLREEVDDLQAQLSLDSTALQSAVIERELAKSQSGNDRSRLDAYLAEIDRLKLSEASLSYQLETLQRQSANDELGLVDLRKKVEKLEEDKDLLNVALESKQTEVTLLQRQLGPRASAPATPRAQRTAASTRVPQTPTGAASVPQTPKRIVPSASTPSIKFNRREASVIMSTPRTSIAVAAPASASRAVLGLTTRHNRTPEKVKPRDAGMIGSKPAPTQKGLKRQSSLPVLSTRLKPRITEVTTRKVMSLMEEEGEETVS